MTDPSSFDLAPKGITVPRGVAIAVMILAGVLYWFAVRWLS